MTVIQNICLLLISAYVLGLLAARLRQPELLGHMIAGIALGPALFGWVDASPALNAIADLAVLFVVISAGLEMRLHSVASVFKGNGLIALLPGFLVPAIAGGITAYAFHFSPMSTVVIALCTSVTALPVALRILSSFNLLSTRLAYVTIASGLLGDVAVLLTLGVLSSAAKEDGNVTQLLGVGLMKVAMLAAMILAGVLISKAVYRRMALQPSRLASTQLSVGLVLILLFAIVCEAIGFTFVVGAFLGTLLVNEYHTDNHTPHPLRAHVDGLSTYVFAPLFLACQGTHFTVDAFTRPAFALTLLLVAIASKLIGGYWTGRWCGLPHHDARGVAIVMNARGVMEMVIASIAYRAGLVDESLFSTLLIIGVCTTVCTPLMLRHWQRSDIELSAVASKIE
ncbi:MAG TPA: cation:proton antiporter [Steroidobacteraceae bacterium]|nr:cation:proton antiporter [Steroidobacteraceae bacterium]